MQRSSDIDIVNKALSHLKARQIANFNDNSREAQVAGIHYSAAVQELLDNDVDWSFARTRRKLVASPDVSLPAGWAYAWLYPADAIKIRGIAKDFETEPHPWFEVGVDDATGVQVVYTTKDWPVVTFTRFIDNPLMFSPSFAAALEWYLASKMAVALTGEIDRQKWAFQMYQTLILPAASSNLNEGIPEPERDMTEEDAPWIRNR